MGGCPWVAQVFPFPIKQYVEMHVQNIQSVHQSLITFWAMYVQTFQKYVQVIPNVSQHVETYGVLHVQFIQSVQQSLITFWAMKYVQVIPNV